MGCGPDPKHDRNWAIWREYNAGDEPARVFAARHNVTPARVIQIVRRCDKQMKAALERQLQPVGLPLGDAVRDGLLGVEFTFTMADPWDVHNGRKDWGQLSDGSWFKFNIGAKR